MKKKYAVIGDPIAHSLSPQMHNKLFSLYKISANYEQIQIKQENLAKELRKLKCGNYGGFNVTVPHKTRIIPLLDKVDPLAKEIGAVNTVVKEAGKFVGYNTDGLGFVHSLQEIEPDLFQKKVLIIGAGGAARAIFFTLAKQGVTKIDITNRTIEKARELIKSCPFKIKSKSYSLLEAEEIIASYDIVIQTTTIGMAPKTDEKVLSLRNLKAGTIVSDIVYNPLKTKFLEEAEDRGAVIQNGVGMFVYQGALAFNKWTGIFPDTEIMETTVLENL